MKKVKRIVLWFRQDLRLHDNEALTAAIARGEEIYPIYVFDTRVFEAKTRFGFAKTGAFRAKFIIEAVKDLRQSLQKLGINLIVRVGKPEEEVFKVANALKSSWVFCNREPTHEEAEVQLALERRLWTVGQELQYYRGKMLYYTQDLPFPICQTPDIFTNFRKEVEKIVVIRPPWAAPTAADFNRWTQQIEVGDIPNYTDFGHAPIQADARAAFDFRGGETAALARLAYYLEGSHCIKTYEETRNGLIGGDYSSKFSAYLAQGCLSPKLIYAELQQYEAKHGANKSTYWLFFELLWRDFFRLMGKKYGTKIFLKGGLLGRERRKMSNDKTAFERWANAQTGEPFVDANMRELNATGFMSNRGRQNVASYLINDLKVNWQMGAEYFESLLVDYDVCSNWCNWNYAAGVGNDPRDERYFNPQTQAQKYDPQGDYVRLWDK